VEGPGPFLRGRRHHHAPDSGGPCPRQRPEQAPDREGELLAIDDALTRLAANDERAAKVVELHYFGGLTYDEIAEALGVSAATVDRDLRFAKAWLYRELKDDG
jgi:RNA polymerase sigma factor (sigma-70 family)